MGGICPSNGLVNLALRVGLRNAGPARCRLSDRPDRQNYPLPTGGCNEYAPGLGATLCQLGIRRAPLGLASS